jgi:hypothetical protein
VGEAGAEHCMGGSGGMQGKRGIMAKTYNLFLHEKSRDWKAIKEGFFKEVISSRSAKYPEQKFIDNFNDHKCKSINDF